MSTVRTGVFAILCLSLLSFSICLLGCSDDTTGPDPGDQDWTFIKSSLPRDESPSVSADDWMRLAAGNHLWL